MKGNLPLAFAAACAAWMGLAQEPAVRVDITSQPEGATVIVDGQDRGVTPLTLFDLEPGRHQLKYRLAGYVERDRFFKVEEGVPLQRSAVLEPEKGLLLVKSVPEGCNISIDGISVGRTPRLITNLDTKDSHKVTLRAAGYRPSTFEVKFNGRTPLVREETLVLDSGIVEIQTEPAGADVVVNGIAHGKTPVTVSDIPKGRATVKLSLDGFREESRELSINAGDRQVLSVLMQGLPGTLSLFSVPEGARFYVNGEYRGKTSVVIPGLAPGDYVVRAELEGYGTETRHVTLDNGSKPREEFRLSNQMGRIELRTSPVGVQVLLDGRIVGTTKSSDEAAEYSDVFAIENVLEGEHVLLLRADGHAEVVRHPKIQRAKTLPLKFALRRIFKPDVEIQTDQGTYRGVLVRNKNTADFVTIEVKPGIEQSFPKTSIRGINFLELKK